MKTLIPLMTLSLVILSISFGMAQNSMAPNSTIEKANAPRGNSLINCKERGVGNIGFFNPYKDSLFVVLIKDLNELAAHFKIKNNETKYQTGLRTAKHYTYHYYVFTSDPGRNVQEIQNNPNFKYKSAVYPVQCENEVITIAY